MNGFPKCDQEKVFHKERSRISSSWTGLCIFLLSSLSITLSLSFHIFIVNILWTFSPQRINIFPFTFIFSFHTQYIVDIWFCEQKWRTEMREWSNNQKEVCFGISDNACFHWDKSVNNWITMSPVSRSTEQHSAKQENYGAHSQTLHEGVGSHMHTACVQVLSCVWWTSPRAGGRCSSGGVGGEHLNRRCCGRPHCLCADVQWTARLRHHHRCRQIWQRLCGTDTTGRYWWHWEQLYVLHTPHAWERLPQQHTTSS